jgi:DNA-binding NarL/FixJ family response regulator
VRATWSAPRERQAFLPVDFHRSRTVNQGEGPKIPPRLRAVGKLLAKGRNNEEIATALDVQLHTAENYVSELKELLGARDRVELVKKCEEMRSWLL